MAALPQSTKTTATEIYRAVREGADRAPRAHLGASQIGKPCRRELWYSFRWCGDDDLSGRILRLFRRGELEEAQLVADLRAAGIEVVDRGPEGQQWRVSALGGHFGGSMDGVGRGFPECSAGKWHLLEFKTANDRSFKELVKKGVEAAKPEHYAQMQVYMLLSGDTDEQRLQRAMYIAVNKNTDDIYVERVKYHGPTARALMKKAQAVIESSEPLEKVSTDPAWFECKFCSFHSVCHGDKLPPANCRTCCHSTPIELHWKEREKGKHLGAYNGGMWLKWVQQTKGMQEGPAWYCEKHQSVLSAQQQQTGCEHHVYIPALVSFAQAGDGNEAENWMEYTMLDGRKFKNGTRGPGCYESRELRALDVSLIADKDIEAMRMQMQGAVEPVAVGEFVDDEIPF